MLAAWANIDVPSAAILESKPRNRSKQRIAVPHSRQHLAVTVWVEQADLENL